MSATISVIVPTYNSESTLRQCLESIVDQTFSPANVVICDGGSTDATVDIARSYGVTLVHASASRSAQRNIGAIHALGEYVVFIDSDMKITSEVLQECVNSFSVHDAALVIPEVDIGKSYWARVKGFERTFYRGVWWLQAARCFRKSQFVEIGGFDVGLIGAEDWDLDERIRQFGRVREISSKLEHDEGGTSFDKIMKKKTHYSASFDVFKKRHPKRAAFCFSARERAWLIARQPGRLVSHPILASGMASMGILEILVSRGLLRRWVSSSAEERPMKATENPLHNGEPPFEP